MAQLHDFYGCCGAVELHGLSNDPKKILLEVGPNILHSWGLVLFTDTIQYANAGCTCDDPECEEDHDKPEDREGPGNGIALEKFIKEQELGGVVATQPTYNPNSENEIAGWIWSVNQIALAKWLKENKPKPVRRRRVVL